MAIGYNKYPLMISLENAKLTLSDTGFFELQKHRPNFCSRAAVMFKLGH